MAAAELSSSLSAVPQHWPVSLYEYHRDRTCESNSSLKLFLENRWLYYLDRVLGRLPWKPSSDATALGSALHVKLLEPDTYEDQVIVIDCGRGAAKGKKVCIDNPAKHVITEDQDAKVAAMLESIQSSPEAMALLERRVSAEHPIRWLHENTGIGLKACFDLLLDDDGIVDLKTASNPDLSGYGNFGSALWEYAYYRQAALYCMGRNLYRPLYSPRDEFDIGYHYIVVGNEFPFQTFVYRLSPAWLERGGAHNELIMEALQGCRDYSLGDNPEPWRSPNQGRVVLIDMPEWVAKKEILL